MKLNNKYITVKPLEKSEEKSGFSIVETQDNSTFTGEVVEVPSQPVWIGDHQVKQGDVVVFAKYSPDTHQIKDVKFINTNDILAVE